MSAHDTTHDAHGHDDHGHAEEGIGHVSMGGYVTGFILSAVLTAIPFWIVMAKLFDKSSTTAIVILAFAAVQIAVHMIYFLHMNFQSQAGWTMLALIFTVVLVVITLSGTLWVMFHLNSNMMPGVADVRSLP